MIALAFALVGLAALGMTAAVTLAVWYHGAIGQLDAASDRLAELGHVSDQYRGERDNAVAELAVTKDLLSEERKLRAAAEAARDEAWSQARESIANEIATSDIANAVAVGNRILSSPLPSVRRSESGNDALEKP